MWGAMNEVGMYLKANKTLQIRKMRWEMPVKTTKAHKIEVLIAIFGRPINFWPQFKEISSIRHLSTSHSEIKILKCHLK